MKNKLKIIVIMAAVFALTLTGCGNSATEEKTETETTAESKVIRIGDQPKYFTVKVALEKGFFEEEFGDEYEVELSSFVDGPTATQAFIAGEIDFALYGDTPAVNAFSSGTDIRIISPLYSSDDSFKVIAGKDSGITTTADFKGKRIAFQAGTNDHKMLLKLLESQNLTIDDITAINLGESEDVAALISGDVDAVFASEPNIDTVLEQTGGRIVEGTAGIAVLGVYVIADNQYAKANPDIAAGVLRVFDKTNKWILENEDEAAEIVANYVGGSADDLKKFYDSEEWVTTWNDEFTEGVEDTIKFSYDQGSIKEIFDVFDLVDTTYLEKAGLY